MTSDDPLTAGTQHGWYGFENLLTDENFDGVGGGEPTYVLSVPTPSGMTSSPINQGGNDALDADNPNGQTATLVQGYANTQFDFGFQPALALTADLQITKTGLPNPVLAGQSLTYEIVVTNLGPDDVTGASVADTLPTALSNITWIATATGGATSGTASLSGHDFTATASLPVLSTLTYTIHATVAPGTTGSLYNTATVTAPSEVTDPNLLNNQANATTLLGQLIDNQDPSSFSRLGNWTLGSPCAGFFGDDVVYTAPGSGATATWTFTGLTAGQAYQVSTTWFSPPAFASNRSTAAPFTLSGGAILPPVPVNQQLNPVDYTPHFSYLGSVWMNLSASYTVTGTTLTVTLTSAPDGYCLGDAILVQQVPAGLPAPPPAPAPVAGPLVAPTGSGEAANPAATSGSNLVPSFADARLLDNGGPGYSTSGRWSTVTGTGYQSGVQSIACTSCGDSFANWQFDNLSPWLTYQVYATWVSGPDRNAQAGYRLYQDVVSARNMTARVAANQQVAPSDLALQGVSWELLGEVTPNRGTLSVQLTNAGQGLVVADAVLVVPLVPSPDPRLTVLVDGHVLAPGAAAVDFGIAAVGTTQKKTLVLRNTGNGSLTLSGAWAVPDGFEISGLPATQLAPGQFTTVTLTRPAGTPGTLRGTLTFPTNDPAASSFSIQVTGDVVSGLDAAAGAGGGQGAALTPTMTQGLVAAAVERWLPAGISLAQAAAIRALPIQIRDLPGDMLCAITSTRILIDTDAAGRGWFVDASPWEDAEYVVDARPTGIDLLTVLTHEVGRQLGLTSNSQPGGEKLLSLSTMPTQARRVPSGVFLVGQNPVNPLDVDCDGQVFPLDVLRLISRINAGGSPLTSVEPGVAPQFFDVTGDNILSALDVLHVVNFINSAAWTQATGEAPATFDIAPPELVMVEPLNTAAATVGPNQNANQWLTSTDASHVATALPEPMVLKEPTRSPTVTPPRGSSPWMDAEADWESLLDVLAQDAAAAWGRLG